MTKHRLKQLINEVLLTENPDTVKYKGNFYRYTSSTNRSAFFVYRDRNNNKETLFGYSAIKKEFFSSDDDVIVKLKEYEQNPNRPSGGGGGSSDDDYDYYDLKRFYNEDRGGGHSDLEGVLSALGISYNEPERGRLFEIDDGGIKVVICTFWNGKNDVLKYMSFWEQAIEFNGYNPKDIIYEPYKNFMTYEQFVDPNYRYVPTELKLRNGSMAKVGDRLIYLSYSTDPNHPNNPEVILKTIANDEEGTVEVVKCDPNDYEYKVGDTKRASGRYLIPVSSRTLPPEEQVEDIKTVIDNKTSEFVEKRASLHTTGARLTPAEKQNLENEVDKLEIEIKGLKYLLDNSSFTKMTSDAKYFLQKFIDHEMAKKHAEKKDAYSLIKQAEKQYNMPIAQLRQKYRGVPLDQLVKKESLYRKIMKQMLLN